MTDFKNLFVAGQPARPLYVVDAERDGRFWFLKVRDRPELRTQALRLDQAEAMVRDLVATWNEVDPDSFGVVVLPEAPAEAKSLVEAAVRAKVAATAAQARASLAIRAAARALTDAGLTVRDAGAILGVTHQRVAQLVAEPAPAASDIDGLIRWIADETRASSDSLRKGPKKPKGGQVHRIGADKGARVVTPSKGG